MSDTPDPALIPRRTVLTCAAAVLRDRAHELRGRAVYSARRRGPAAGASSGADQQRRDHQADDLETAAKAIGRLREDAKGEGGVDAAVAGYLLAHLTSQPGMLSELRAELLCHHSPSGSRTI